MSEEGVPNQGLSQESIEVFRDSILESFSEVQDPRTLISNVRHDLVPERIKL